MASPKQIKIFAALFAIVAWLGVASQFYVSIPAYLAKGRTIGGALVELCSFFTIQTNILVAICFTVAATNAPATGFFKRAGTLTAMAVNISIVALVYNLLLRQTFHPVGLARVSDELLHVVTPALFIIYWLAFVPGKVFKWIDGLPWLWYPLFYLIYILIRGALSGIYPYFFLDVPQFGYPKVLINIGVLILVFLIMDMLYILISKILNKYWGR